ncbi:MAG TPA: response regulator [Pirellulales bacterium]|nr:response regulator [Pirellulales bacterium]
MTKSKRILLADDDEALVRALALRCRTLGLDVRTANDGASALEMFTADPPDMACLDVSMPGVSGLTLCESLLADERFSSVPIVILTGQPGCDVVRRCHAAAAYYVPKCADVWGRIEPLLVELLELQRPVRGQSAVETVARGEASSTTSTPWVLCIDDDQDLSRSLQLRLEAHGVAVVRASGGMEGYRYAFRYPADAIILDYNLPDGRGDYVLRRLKENPATKDLPVIVLTGVTDHSVERTLRNLGAAGYFTKPIVFPQLLAELAKHMDVLEHAAI